MALLTFSEALAMVPPKAKPKVLLGNGFSRACRNDIFAYDALFERADFTALSPSAQRSFEALGTTDFEVVMRALRETARLLALYDGVPAHLAPAMIADADALREVLVRAIAGSHPARPNDISDDRYAACRRFLSNFETYYTVNYDLLLYWAAMHDDVLPAIAHDDGFRTPDAGEQEYVTWDIEKTNDQNVHYLHGALHVFDTGSDLLKFTWKHTQIRLIAQIRDALSQNRYPLFVAEGDSRQKLARIRHSDFLSRAYRSFANIGGCLFVYGLSFADNDDHILRLIARRKSKVTMLFVSIYGDPESEANKLIMRRAEGLNADRPERKELFVRFFDAESAKVWG